MLETAQVRCAEAWTGARAEGREEGPGCGKVAEGELTERSAHGLGFQREGLGGIKDGLEVLGAMSPSRRGRQ